MFDLMPCLAVQHRLWFNTAQQQHRFLKPTNSRTLLKEGFCDYSSDRGPHAVQHRAAAAFCSSRIACSGSLLNEEGLRLQLGSWSDCGSTPLHFVLRRLRALDPC